MNAKKWLKTLDYLPRWAWYVLSLFVAGPFGIFGVYLVFHVLGKMAQEQTEQEQARFDGSGVYSDEECTVTSDEDVSARWKQTEASADSARTAQRAAAFAEDADTDEVIRAGYDAMSEIRRANDIIADETLSRQIDSIEQSCGQILSILEQRPQLLSQLRTFLRYYLPTTLKLLSARAKLENSANTPKAREVRARISAAVGEIDKAFRKQVEALDAYRFLDLESEMDVLADMLKADGLIDEEDHSDPFASVMGRR